MKFKTFKFKLFNQRINIKLPKIKLSRKHRNILERHRQNIPAAILMGIMFVGLMTKQPIQARHGAAKGAFVGGATGAALGGALGGGRGAIIGAGTGIAVGTIAGSASDDSRKRKYSDPLEDELSNLKQAKKQRNKLYSKRDK